MFHADKLVYIIKSASTFRSGFYYVNFLCQEKNFIKSKKFFVKYFSLTRNL